jgi:O-antigen/teichoic acid export membrane protein
MLIKNTGILILRLVIVSVLGLYTTKILLSKLGTSSFGLVILINSIILFISMFNTVLMTSTFNSISKSLTKKDITESRISFNVSFICHSILALLIILFFNLSPIKILSNFLNLNNEQSRNAIILFKLSSFTLAFLIITIPFQALISAKENFILFSIIEILKSTITFIIVYTLPNKSNNTLFLYSILLPLTTFIPFIFYYSYCRLTLKEIVRFQIPKNFNLYKKFIFYSGYVFMGSLGYIAQREGLNLILGRFFSTIASASYGIANSLNNAVQIISRNLGQASLPKITSQIYSENNEEAIHAISNISKFSFLLIFIPGSILYLEADFILKLWLGNTIPLNASLFLRLLIINTLIESLTSGVSVIMVSSKKVKFYMFFSGIFSFLYLPVSFLLITLFNHKFKSEYLFIILIFFSFLNYFLTIFLLKYFDNFNLLLYLKKSTLICVKVILISIPILYLFLKFINNDVIKIFITLFWITIVIYKFGLSKSEQKLLGSLFNNILRFQ